MRADLGTDLFDVALLADAISGKRIEGPINVAPFCPMLTQGWQLLRVKEVSLAERVERARDDMRQALWTTFGPRGMVSIFSANAMPSARPPRVPITPIVAPVSMKIFITLRLLSIRRA